MTGFSQRLDLRTSQNLVMTPQLQQAIKLLQMSNMELAEFVEGEIAQNPLLEKADLSLENSSSDPSLDGLSRAEADAREPPAESVSNDDVQEGFDQNWTVNEVSSPSSQDSSGDFDSGVARIGSGGSQGFETMDEGFEQSLKQEETLRDHLLGQLHMAFDDPRDHLIGTLLIDMLDEAGYLRQDVGGLAEKLGCETRKIESLLCTMKRFSPAGIFAADLKECLALQLEEQGKLDAPMALLLEHLDLLGRRDFTALCKICGVNSLYLQEMIAEVKALDPKPGAKFESMIVQTVVADVLMKRRAKNLGGGWRVELNSETLPRVLVNNDYYTQVCAGTKEKKDREYITTQLQNANWLVKALDQRAQTILKVASEIVEQQDAFFNFGIEFLRPMTLKDVAEAISMHESTVSRVTTGKYIGTPRGIFELKYFFSTALVSSDGIAHSAESVRARIKALIDSESPDGTFSDDTLVDMLQKEGIDVARRTIAKYREGMGISSSVQRRREKKQQ